MERDTPIKVHTTTKLIQFSFLKEERKSTTSAPAIKRFNILINGIKRVMNSSLKH